MNNLNTTDFLFAGSLILLSSILLLSTYKILFGRKKKSRNEFKRNIQNLRQEKIAVKCSDKSRKIRRRILNRTKKSLPEELQLKQARKYNISVGEFELASKLNLMKMN